MAATKCVAILVENDCQDHEDWYPYYRFKEEGCTVVTVGTGSAEIYQSKTVIGNNLITARRPDNPPRFVRAIINVLRAG